MIKNLITCLQTITSIPKTELKRIPFLFHPIHITKGTHFLRQGEIQKEIGFVTEGLFRYYYVDKKGNEHTKHFVFNNNFVLSLTAFLNHQQSMFFIQAVENSTILKISASELESLIRDKTFWKDVYLYLLEKSFLIKEERTADFLLKDAKERYLSFTAKYPTLVKRIKRYHLASFLGIQPESLSRIKKINKL